MNAALNIAVIGSGRIGKIHIANLLQHVAGARVVAVSDPLIDDSADWLSAMGVRAQYKDHRKMLAAETLDAVFVCSSTDSHLQIITELARAGKHIFCEKPIDVSAEGVKEILRVVEDAGVTFQVGFNRRFDHNFAALQQRVQSAEVGVLHLIKITSRDPAPPPIEYIRTSGGIFLDMTIHDFDMIRFLSGSEVRSLSVAGAALIDPAIAEAGDIDTALITLWLENGALALIDNSRQAVYGYDQRVEVFGSKGMMRVENDLPSTLRVLTAEGERGEKPLHFFLERYAQAYRSEAESFVDAVLAEREAVVSGRDGLMPIYIALAAQRSLAERRVVDLEEVI